jgi:hypothetical protein
MSIYYSLTTVGTLNQDFTALIFLHVHKIFNSMTYLYSFFNLPQHRRLNDEEAIKQHKQAETSSRDV